MSKLIVMLRVKDGRMFLNEWLSCYEKIADGIVVVDNGSTDGTFELLKSHPKVIEIERTEGFNEGRDKNLMYKLARKHNPDWCLWVDVDEIFEENINRHDFDKMMNSKLFNKFSFRRFHFTDENHFAASFYWLFYVSTHDRILWRESSSGYFQDVIIDSPNVKGIKGLTKPTNIRIKHLGYISKKIVDKKANIYRKIIPEKESTFQKMYIQNERKFKWIVDRKDIRVVLLNQVLNIMYMFKLFVKLLKGVNSYLVENKKERLPDI